MKKLGILIPLFLIFACGSNLVNNDDALLKKKLNTIRDWINSTRILSLPMTLYFDSTVQNTHRLMFNESDSIFANDFKNAGGDVYLIGFLPDTSKYFGVIFNSVAAVHNPGIITFTKDGEYINLELLTKEKCVNYGRKFFCDEHTTISKDLKLSYYYKSLEEHDKPDMTYDTICEIIESQGLIKDNGKVELGKMISSKCK
jgi:hypothetical protein